MKKFVVSNEEELEEEIQFIKKLFIEGPDYSFLELWCQLSREIISLVFAIVNFYSRTTVESR